MLRLADEQPQFHVQCHSPLPHKLTGSQIPEIRTQAFLGIITLSTTFYPRASAWLSPELSEAEHLPFELL